MPVAGNRAPEYSPDDYTLFQEWQFPCQTMRKAQEICERLAGTGDTSELTRLDAGHYPLDWQPLRIDDNGPWVILGN